MQTSAVRHAGTVLMVRFHLGEARPEKYFVFWRTWFPPAKFQNPTLRQIHARERQHGGRAKDGDDCED